ncbi:MAG: NfeD family protein [Bacteroidota bacterium]
MLTKFRSLFILMAVLLTSFQEVTDSIPADDSKTKVYVFSIQEQIAKPAVRLTQKAFDEAVSIGADYIIIRLNTYGGLVDAADSIRTRVLNSPIPVFVFIDNNAASAGALISIAADSIYMRPGGNIGAATVVNQTGEAVPDKYQSYMRSTMRSTAEAHGKDTVIRGNDTIITWHRDPLIAEAMVDPRTYIEGIVDTGKVLSFTTEEAIEYGYCEGSAKNIAEVIAKAGITDYEIINYRPSGVDRIIGFLLSPVVQGILIMLILGGLYFELQTPGIGFPLGAAVIAAILYFAPLYLEGLAENWEVLVFIIGVILIGVEIFAIPGFGIAGVSGIVLMVVGLTMSMVDNVIFELNGVAAFNKVVKAFAIVMLSMVIAMIGSITLSKRFLTTGSLSFLALQTSQLSTDGFIGIDIRQKSLVGKTGVTVTMLRPSGKVIIDNEIYDAKAEIGYIEKNVDVKVIRDETGQVYVVKLQ